MINNISLLVLPVILLIIFVYAMFKKVAIYEEFVEGAKDGFLVSISIIPYLVALIVAISMMRASGLFDTFSSFLANIFGEIIPSDVFPIMLTRSLSGSATLGLLAELASKNGVDTYVTQLAAVMVGSSETTLYILSVYFGSIGIKKFRYALFVGLIADVIGIVLAVFVARLFFLANTGF